jgi:polysaccharide export outer membrane protein
MLKKLTPSIRLWYLPVQRLVSVLTLSFLSLAATSCAFFTQGGPAPESGSLEPPSEYFIGPEDVLEISVWKEEGLEREVLVRPDGKVSFPLAGDVQAEGRTPEQVQRDITSRLQRYIPDPVVTVTVKEIGGNKVYVIGLVKAPGSYVIGRYVDVIQALTLAGGLTPFASENSIKVIRRRGAEEIVFPFEYSKVKKGSNLEQNIFLKGGDVVVVP